MLKFKIDGEYIDDYINDSMFNLKVYTPQDDTWAVSDTLELPGFHEGFCAVANDDAIYVVGGYDENGGRKRLQKLSLDDGTLTTLADMAENRTAHCCAFYQNGLVAAGGYAGNSEIIGDIKPQRKVEYYDFESGKAG